MKAFKDFMRNSSNNYSNKDIISNIFVDENKFQWSSKCIIHNNGTEYRIYRLPSKYTKALTKHIKVPKMITHDYGYCVENNCIKMYIKNKYIPIDKTLITLLQCHTYAMFMHTQSIYNGSNAIKYMEDKCIKDGLYFNKKSIKNCSDITVYELSGVFENNLRGYIYISDLNTIGNNANIDARNTYTEKDTGCGTSISECIVLDGDYGERFCKCVDIYIGTNSNYDIDTQHSNNVEIVKSEAEHKGLDILMQASRASVI